MSSVPSLKLALPSAPSDGFILPDFYGAGYLAAKMLDDIFANGRPRKTRRATYGGKSVIVRESTQDIRGGGRIVNMAKEFIRLNAHERITVSDPSASR